MASTPTRDLQDDFLAATRKSQETVVRAIKTINSGRSSKDRDIEDTAFRTNGEAAAEVTRQPAPARHRRPHRHRLHRHGEQVPQQGG